MLDVRSLGHITIVVPNLVEAEKYYTDLFAAKTIATLDHIKNEGMGANMGLKGLEVSEKILKFVHCNLVLLLMEFHHPQGNSTIEKKQINDQGGVRHVGINVENIDGVFDLLKQRHDVEILNTPEFRPLSYSKISPDQFHFNNPEAEQNGPEKERLADLLSQKKTFYFRDKYGVIWEVEERYFQD